MTNPQAYSLRPLASRSKKIMNKIHFSTLLIEWYQNHKRNLPWRKTKDPYKIWLSEVLLQQTRVNQGLPYYIKFVKRFATVNDLAHAHEKEVLRLWQGLGYYSRARNLHKCAKIVSNDFKGRFPKTVDLLKKLPGIGDYTAAAIASLAFQQPAAVVDGNVFRFLSRLYGISLNISSPEGKKYFFELANSLISRDHPGEFNQAMMEFGSVQCMPRNPKCGDCIFSKQCVAFKTESQSLYPVKPKPKKKKVRYFNYFVVRVGKKIWMHLRKEKDIWEGLHEFYLIESNRQLGDSTAFHLFRSETGINPKVPLPKSYRIKQVLSHQEIIGKFFEVSISNIKPFSKRIRNGEFYSNKEIETLAKPVLITNYLKHRGFSTF